MVLGRRVLLMNLRGLQKNTELDNQSRILLSYNVQGATCGPYVILCKLKPICSHERINIWG